MTMLEVNSLETFQRKLSNDKKDNKKAETLKKKIDIIKSYDRPPFIENDAYYSREPWRKFGAYFDGFGWFENVYIYAKATEEDVENAYKEITRGDEQ